MGAIIRDRPGWKKTGFLTFLIIALLIHPAMASPQEDTTISCAPLNPEFLEYRNETQKDPSILANAEASQQMPFHQGLAPAPFNTSHLKNSEIRSVTTMALKQGLPSTYDLRDQGRMTPAKDQGQTGSCWTFATYGSLESCTYGEGPYDFSENHMKNLMSNQSPIGFDFEQGGHIYMSMAYLAGWLGPVNESDDLYNDSSSYDDYTNPYIEPSKHIKEVIILPARSDVTDNTPLKEAIMEYGALYSSFYLNGTGFDNNYTTYYYNGSCYQGGHAVTLAGWNDTYPKENFVTTPPGDGAFIIKNSWGTSIGDDGYLYISYYENAFCTQSRYPAAFKSLEDADRYDLNYQYDPMGLVNNIGNGQENAALGANVFEATSNQYLEAVSFYTVSRNTTYNVSIYTNCSLHNNSNRTSPGVLRDANISGTLENMGYYVLELDKPVYLKKGESFAVVVRFETPDTKYPIPVEYPVNGYSSRALANANESFFSENGSLWQDVGEQNYSICIKAFTSLPPEGISNLTSTSGPSWVNWTWDDPSIEEFDHSTILFNGTMNNTTSGYYNATGLLDGVNYSITVRTVDDMGRINLTVVNDTSMTIDIAPQSVTDLRDTMITTNSIQWTWTNPTSHDFNHVEIRIDDELVANTSGNSYRASGLLPNRDCNISLQTVDTAGNRNTSLIYDLSRTHMTYDNRVRTRGLMSTPEDQDNIITTTTLTHYASAGNNISYRYEGEEALIVCVNFTSKKNAGYVKVITENLEDTSDLVERKPPGKVYSNLNIWAGDETFDKDDITDPQITFRVSRQWILNNNYVPEDIRLFHFSDTWTELKTTLIDQDEEYYYFRAKTPDFSPFAISAIDKPATSSQKDTEEGSKVQVNDGLQEDRPDAQDRSVDQATQALEKDTPGFTSLVFVEILGLLTLLKRRF